MVVVIAILVLSPNQTGGDKGDEDLYGTTQAQFKQVNQRQNCQMAEVRITFLFPQKNKEERGDKEEQRDGRRRRRRRKKSQSHSITLNTNESIF